MLMRADRRKDRYFVLCEYIYMYLKVGSKSSFQEPYEARAVGFRDRHDDG